MKKKKKNVEIKAVSMALIIYEVNSVRINILWNVKTSNCF
jgi:hypothetical protein